MKKHELIESIANSTDSSKAAAGRFLEALESTLVRELKTTGEVTIPGIGKLSAVQRVARVTRSPMTGGKSIEIPARVAPKFSPTSTLKAALNT